MNTFAAVVFFCFFILPITAFLVVRFGMAAYLKSKLKSKDYGKNQKP